MNVALIQITCRLRRGEAIANEFRLIGLLDVAAARPRRFSLTGGHDQLIDLIDYRATLAGL
jgi:hypothetical protein